MDTPTFPTPAHDVPVTVRWLNPIGRPTFDAPISELLHAIKLPSTRVEVLSLAMAASSTHLEYRAYEALTYAPIVHIARDSAQHNIDALVLGCFYDPALEDAREISGQTVVIGPCQASVQVAANLANRFSIIVGHGRGRVPARSRPHPPNHH